MIEHGNVSHIGLLLQKKRFLALSIIKNKAHISFFSFYASSPSHSINKLHFSFFIYKRRFMPFPVRTPLVPKSSKTGFPWCQGPSKTTWTWLTGITEMLSEALLETHKHRRASFLPLLILLDISRDNAKHEGSSIPREPSPENNRLEHSTRIWSHYSKETGNFFYNSE